ncbi:hypothetical protein IAQ61_002163 [Plenodomus lingam]|uniref:uncharacterized protein n=1 Tax=Leptosphaeria maculans TaxID=5022 RepID=UPI0033170316|nr:hypothetical protein IAQ61_002163 [Plenodomus lingam]
MDTRPSRTKPDLAWPGPAVNPYHSNGTGTGHGAGNGTDNSTGNGTDNSTGTGTGTGTGHGGDRITCTCSSPLP